MKRPGKSTASVSSRCRVPAIEAGPNTGDLIIPYVNRQGQAVEETFDLVVLSVGLEIASASGEPCPSSLALT